MIVLSVEKYCHDCPLFEAETEKAYSLDRVVMTQIVCSHRGLCDMLKRHLEAKAEKGRKKTEPKKEGTPLCIGCRRLVECDPLKMALNSEEHPCEDFEI